MMLIGLRTLSSIAGGRIAYVVARLVTSNSRFMIDDLDGHDRGLNIMGR
jgi:hypothetical protein